MPHPLARCIAHLLFALVALCLHACSPDKQPDVTSQVLPQITITLAQSDQDDTLDFTIQNDSSQSLILKAPVVVRPVNAVFGENSIGTGPIQTLPRQWPDDQININILPPVVENLRPNRVYILTYSPTNPPEPINNESNQTLAVPVLIGAYQSYQGQVTSELDFAPSPQTTDLYLAMVIRLEKTTLNSPSPFIRSNWIKINPSSLGH